MKTTSITLPDGNTVDYKIVNGTAYNIKTPDEVIRVLENARATNQRIIVTYGNTSTGASWSDRGVGYVGRSGGSTKIPIILFNTRSHGGGPLLEHCIVKIITAKGRKHLYVHPTFND